MERKTTVKKKLIILYVLNILKAFSSPESPVTQSAICTYLRDIDLLCDRKTIGRNIKYLIDFGYPIKRTRKGYYLLASDINQSKKQFVI